MKQRLVKAKNHVQKNKAVYIAAATGIVVGGAAVALCQNKDTAVKVYTRIIGNHNTVNNITQIILPALGDPGNVVQCIETGTIYASQGQAARELGTSAATVGRHLSGKTPHIKGLHLEVLGKAGQPLA